MIAAEDRLITVTSQELFADKVDGKQLWGEFHIIDKSDTDEVDAMRRLLYRTL